MTWLTMIALCGLLWFSLATSSYGGGPSGKTGNANGFIAAHAESIPVGLRDPWGDNYKTKIKLDKYKMNITGLEWMLQLWHLNI